MWNWVAALGAAFSRDQVLVRCTDLTKHLEVAATLPVEFGRFDVPLGRGGETTDYGAYVGDSYYHALQTNETRQVLAEREAERRRLEQVAAENEDLRKRCREAAVQTQGCPSCGVGYHSYWENTAPECAGSRSTSIFKKPCADDGPPCPEQQTKVLRRFVTEAGRVEAASAVFAPQFDDVMGGPRKLQNCRIAAIRGSPGTERVIWTAEIVAQKGAESDELISVRNTG